MRIFAGQASACGKWIFTIPPSSLAVMTPGRKIDKLHADSAKLSVLQLQKCAQQELLSMRRLQRLHSHLPPAAAASASPTKTVPKKVHPVK
jgi:hypothetical protein